MFLESVSNRGLYIYYTRQEGITVSIIPNICPGSGSDGSQQWQIRFYRSGGDVVGQL